MRAVKEAVFAMGEYQSIALLSYAGIPSKNKKANPPTENKLLTQLLFFLFRL